MKILQFQGEYRWLSNFVPCKIIIKGVTYKSVEHAYMSEKSDNPEWKKICQEIEKPGEVKRRSRSIQLVDDWNNKKIKVMMDCINQKYNQEPYKSKLLATGDVFIQEGNNWHDIFWGVDLSTGEGLNVLGKMIMEKRNLLQKEMQNNYKE